MVLYLFETNTFGFGLIWGTLNQKETTLLQHFDTTRHI